MRVGKAKRVQKAREGRQTPPGENPGPGATARESRALQATRTQAFTGAWGRNMGGEDGEREEVGRL